MSKIHPILLYWNLALAGMFPASAVVVSTGIPNTTAPVGMPYFYNVGSVTNAAGTSTASAVYLGDGWVLTADHVAPGLPADGKVKFSGTSYNSVPGSWHRLQNPGGLGLSVYTDLVMFQLSADPGLPSMQISAASPTVGQDVMMIGDGRIQSSSLTGWDVTVVAGSANDIWTEVVPASSGDLQGYKVSAAQQISWGVNELNTVGGSVNLGTYGDIVSLSTRFDQGAGAFTQEAQAINGDSGGALLSFNGVSWSLIGLMHAVNNYETQPYNTSIYGQSTYGSDLSVYRPQILALMAVPEPSAILLVGCAMPFVFRRKV